MRNTNTLVMNATAFPRDSLLYAVKRMPAAPRILASLGRLLLDMTTGIGDFSALLRRDPALTARIIRISNSAVYSVGSSYGSLEEALARVGFMEVYRLTGFAAVAQVSDQNLRLYNVTGTQLRENSLCVAIVLEEIAKSTGKIDSPGAYTAGLLRSIGKLALDGLTRDGPYEAVYHPRVGPVAEWETGVAGLNNCEAAAVVLQEWHFARDTIEAIHGHYVPGEGAAHLTHMLNLAAGVAESWGHGLPGETSYWRESEQTLVAVGLDRTALRPALDQARRIFDSVRTAIV
jgi:HD-like signal output (HDOD) protein